MNMARLLAYFYRSIYLD